MNELRETLIYSAIGTVGVFGALTLLPLWIGMITSHPRKLRLALVPTAPFVFAAFFFNWVFIANAGDIDVDNFTDRLLIALALTTGLSAFALWIVTWALFKRWRASN